MILNCVMATSDKPHKGVTFSSLTELKEQQKRAKKQEHMYGTSTELLVVLPRPALLTLQAFSLLTVSNRKIVLSLIFFCGFPYSHIIKNVDDFVIHFNFSCTLQKMHAKNH